MQYTYRILFVVYKTNYKSHKDESERLGLEVNLDKTQIVAFRKEGHLSKYEQRQYGTNNLNAVNSYKYSGIGFSTKLSFVNCGTSFIMKAKQIMNRISEVT